MYVNGLLISTPDLCEGNAFLFLSRTTMITCRRFKSRQFNPITCSPFTVLTNIQAARRSKVQQLFPHFSRKFANLATKVTVDHFTLFALKPCQAVYLPKVHQTFSHQIRVDWCSSNAITSVIWSHIQ